MGLPIRAAPKGDIFLIVPAPFPGSLILSAAGKKRLERRWEGHSPWLWALGIPTEAFPAPRSGLWGFPRVPFQGTQECGMASWASEGLPVGWTPQFQLRETSAESEGGWGSPE